MSHYRDLRESYAKQMEYHGCGMALFQPISSQDMTPPCCGYFDRNGDWNLIARLSTVRQSRHPVKPSFEQPGNNDYEPLAFAPTKVADVKIEWQPKTSLGVVAYTIEGSGTMFANPSGSAEAHIKYASISKFGAVLMTTKPITLHAYNHERLFLSWLDANRQRLYNAYGAELKKYGMWIVTRTYCAPSCSITAWIDKNKQAIVSAKAKAAMLGELEEELSWRDKLLDKDWCHYTAKTPGDGVVVFMDGIQVKAFEWWKEGIKHTLTNHSQDRLVPGPAPMQGRPPRLEQLQTGGHTRQESHGREPLLKTLTVDAVSPVDDEVLKDAGLCGFSRSSSHRRPNSLTVSTRNASLRRETRSINRETEENGWSVRAIYTGQK